MNIQVNPLLSVNLFLNVTCIRLHSARAGRLLPIFKTA